MLLSCIYLMSVNLPNKYVSKLSVIGTDGLQMHTMIMLKIVVSNSFIFSWCNSNVTAINGSNNIRKFPKKLCTYEFWHNMYLMKVFFIDVTMDLIKYKYQLYFLTLFFFC